MPRDGSDVYHIPPGTEGEPDTTIESAKYNAFVLDVEQDLNTPRPIIAGGTGASSAEEAMVALGGELAGQVVTNYDSHVFRAGSFLSLAGATEAPSGNAYTGFAYLTDADNIFIEVRDNTDATKNWVRHKKAGVWQPWLQVSTAVASDTAPPTPAPNMLWFDPTVGKTFIWYVDPDSAQWVEMSAVPDVDPDTYVEIAGDTMTGPLTLIAPTDPLHAATKQYVDASVPSRAVLYDAAQSLTTAQKMQARQNVYAAPFDAYGHSGLQVNGGLEIAQNKNLGDAIAVAAGGTAYHMADQWPAFKLGASGTGYLYWQGIYPNLGGISRALMLHANPAITTVGASDGFGLVSAIEAYRWCKLGWNGGGAGRPVTIGFWVHSSVLAGGLALSVRNPTRTHSHVTAFPINAAATWEYKTVTIPAPSAGVWSNTANEIGAYITFTMLCGTSLQTGSPGGWVAGDYTGYAGQPNLFASAGSVYIAGITILPGSESPNPSNIAQLMRPIEQELAACQRYYHRMIWECEGYSNFAFGRVTYTTGFPVPMRVAPSRTRISIGTASNIRGGDTNSYVIATPKNERYCTPSLESNAAGYMAALNVVDDFQARLV